MITTLELLKSPFFTTNLDSNSYYNGGIDTHVNLPGVSKENCNVEYIDNSYFEIKATDVFDKEISRHVYAPNIDLNTVKLEMKDGILFIKGDAKKNTKQLKIK